MHLTSLRVRFHEDGPAPEVYAALRVHRHRTGWLVYPLQLRVTLWRLWTRACS